MFLKMFSLIMLYLDIFKPYLVFHLYIVVYYFVFLWILFVHVCVCVKCAYVFLMSFCSFVLSWFACSCSPILFFFLFVF